MSGSTLLLSPDESPLIARFGRRQGSLVPRLIAASGDDRFSWRFAEPPIDMNPNAPWILRQGEPISEPAPWMVETATLVLATVSRYYEAHMAASPVFAGDEVPPALAALLSGGGLDREVHLRQNQLGGTYVALLRVPYDYGIVAIDLADPDLAHVYSWTFGDNWRLRHRDAEHFGDRVRNAFFTDHALTSLARDEDGVWSISYHVSAARHWENPPTAAHVFARIGTQFLPYYELNASARRALGVMEYEEWFAGRDQ